MTCVSKAALYIRVSTEEQANEGQSVAAQTETLTRFCKLYDIEIFDIYRDLGISGKDTINRPGLQRMLKEGMEGKFNMVLVWKISRLSRNLKDLLQVIDQLERSGIVFSSYSEKFDTSTAVGRMTLQLLGSIAEFERNTIIDNIKLGLQEYARKGGKTGTVLGYEHQGSSLSIVPREAEAVSLIYKLYTIDRMSMSDIAEELNCLGYRTKRNKLFRKDSISVILSNPVYTGFNRHKVGTPEEYHVQATHPSIIDKETWEAAQRLRRTNTHKRPRKAHHTSFLLAGILQCPQCSMPLLGKSTATATKNYSYYRCKACRKSCRAEEMEQTVIAELRQRSELFQAAYIDTSSNTTHFSRLSREIEKQKKLLDKYLLLLDHEDLKNSSVVIQKVTELEKALMELQGKQQAVKSFPQMCHEPKKDWAMALESALMEQDQTRLRDFMCKTVARIELSSDMKFKALHLKL